VSAHVCFIRGNDVSYYNLATEITTQLGFTCTGRGAARAEDAQGTPTQKHISPRILVYEESQARRPDGRGSLPMPGTGVPHL